MQTEYVDQLCRKLQWEEVEESEVQEENETRKTGEERTVTNLEPQRITIQQPPLSMLFIIFLLINQHASLRSDQSEKFKGTLSNIF